MKTTNIFDEFGIYKGKELVYMSQNQIDSLIIEECPYHENCEFTNTFAGLQKIANHYPYRYAYTSTRHDKIVTIDTFLIDFLCKHKDLNLEKMYTGESNLRLYQIVQDKQEAKLINGGYGLHFMKPENAELIRVHKYIGKDNREDFINAQIQSDINSMDTDIDLNNEKALKLLQCLFINYVEKVLYRNNAYLICKQTEEAKKKLCVNVSVFQIPEQYQPKSLYNLLADSINKRKDNKELFEKLPKLLLIEDNENKKVKLFTGKEGDVKELLISRLDMNVEDVIMRRVFIVKEKATFPISPGHIIKKFLLDVNKKLLQYPDLKIGYSISLYVTD